MNELQTFYGLMIFGDGWDDSDHLLDQYNIVNGEYVLFTSEILANEWIKENYEKLSNNHNIDNVNNIKVIEFKLIK